MSSLSAIWDETAHTKYERIESKDMKANLFLSSSKWSGLLSAMLMESPAPSLETLP